MFFIYLFFRVAGDKKPLEMEVTGLEPGHQYKFRVTAVNDEGDSEPLETERATLAKDPFGKIFVTLLINIYRH